MSWKNKAFPAALAIAALVAVGGGGFFAGHYWTPRGQDLEPPERPDPVLDRYLAHPPHQILPKRFGLPSGFTPAQIRKVYNLPSTGGAGTIAIIDAFDDPQAEKDLNVFSRRYDLPECTTENGCFEKHVMTTKITVDFNWASEIALDIEWAHAIAPNAKILLVEAKSNDGTDLIAAVDYARMRADVVAISMSWGGPEYAEQDAYDSHFTSRYGATFFASSGDDGNGASWPAASPNVVSVGGTSVLVAADGTLVAETAWSGSGGGRSAFTPMPDFQKRLGLKGGKRLIPDVSYDADPYTGFLVYNSCAPAEDAGWAIIGGTSAGAPQWAAIKSLGLSANNRFFYQDAALPNAKSFFRDIVTGHNGTCGELCTAAPGYDAVTGLGSPLVIEY